MAKKTKEKVDGLSPHDVEKIRIAIRRVWSWSFPRRKALGRAIGEDGFYYCEKCKIKTPKVSVDHIVPVGLVDSGFIERLFCPSNGLQILCKKCHCEKTKEDRKLLAV